MNNDPRLAYPQDADKKLPKSGHQDATHSIDVLKPEEDDWVFVDWQGESDSKVVNIATRGSRLHAQDPLDVPVSGLKGQEPATPNTGTRGLQTFRTLNMSASERKEFICATRTPGSREQHQFYSSTSGRKQFSTSNTAPVRINEQKIPEYIQNVQLPSAGSLATDVKQSNKFFQNAHSFSISGSPSFQNQNIGSVTNVYGGGTDGLDNLNGFVSFEAQFDSSAQDPNRQCHPGTRENVLKRLRVWVDNPQSKERIFWLYGPAGAGKSAIAQTLAHSYQRPEVPATFFFFKSDVKRNDGNQLFPTLAYQLAFSMPTIRGHIANSLRERPDLPIAGIETQFNQLLFRPFQALSEDAAEQLTPGVDVIAEIMNKDQQLAPVIIIDGVDECSEEHLQRRFLKVIGDAVTEVHFPLRFLIVSRPEVHIEQTVRRFKDPIITIDLAELDDANRDIEKYLVDEFSRIASQQGFEPTWPGPKIIRDIVFKSSGNFIYASVVIKFVGDPYCFAETQLEIVLNIKPPKTTSPFAVLDQLYLEILKRVSDQEFLKKYLSLLAARISVSESYGNLYEDDAVLMHVSEKELHANLQRMRSLLKLGARIDVHHKSFLDFLHDRSRSHQYYVPHESGIEGYLKVLIDSLVRYAYSVIEQPDHHNVPHFTPRFRDMIRGSPHAIDLPANKWEWIIQPLLDLQDKFLQLPNFSSTWNLLPCYECTVFQLQRELLHLGLHHGIFEEQTDNLSVQSIVNVRKRAGVVSLTKNKTEKMKDNNLDSLLWSLFNHLPESTENWSHEVLDLVNDILSFDFSDTVMRVRFISDAQKLIDLLAHFIETKALNGIDPEAVRKATFLAFEIFVAIPVFPVSFFLNGNNKSYQYISTNRTVPMQLLLHTISTSWILDHSHVIPISRVYRKGNATVLDLAEDILPMVQRQQTKFATMSMTRIVLGLAKVIQYVHSMGVALYREFGSTNVFLDQDLCPKICCLCLTSTFLLKHSYQKWFSFEDNIFSFGCIVYELFSVVDTKPGFPTEERRSIIVSHPTRIPAHVWQVINRCCAVDSGSRPTIDEVVKEMENWTIG